MVVSKDGKRKRKESPIVDSSPEVPKRTKVQAQRKFAQGQGNPSVSYSLPTSAIVPSSSQQSTHVRDSKDPIPELIPHKKPSAEDLVTYICFRGTPGLPPHLEFFNQNKKNNENENDKKRDTDLANETKLDSKSSKDANKKGEKSNNKTDKNAKCDNDESKAVNESVSGKSETPEKTETIGYAARKRADQIVEGNRKFKNSDRMPRLRERAPKKLETNRRSPRTRSAFKPESQMEIEEEDDVSEVSDTKKTPPTNTPASGRRKAVSPIQKEDKVHPTEKESEKGIVSNTRNKGTTNKKNAAKTAEAKLAEENAKQKAPIRDEVNNISEEQDSSFPEMDSSPKFQAAPSAEKQDTKTPEKQIPLPAEKSTSITPEKIEKKDSSRKRSIMGSKPTNKGGKKSPLERSVNETPEVTQENSEPNSPKPKRGRKLAESVASKKPPPKETNTNETEKRSSRPMRKTKAAATIYMEWIGLKLNLDDDGSSLDSFPELPNAKETQKIENELKQNRLKEKEEKEVRKSTPTKANKGGRKPVASKKILSESKAEVQTEEQKNEVDETTKSEGIKIANNTSKRKEKNYSDSDDEPLVTQRPETKNIPQPKPSGRGAKKKKLSPKKRGPTVEESKESLPTPVKAIVPDIEIEAKESTQIQEESKLEKNFSDSDDEPLATKLVTKLPEPEVKSAPEPLQIITEITPVAVPRISPPNDEKISPPQNRLVPPVKPELENSTCLKGPTSPKYPVKSPTQPVQPTMPPIIPPVLPPLHRPDHPVELSPIMTLPVISPPGHFTPLERFPSPKVNPSFLTPKFDRHLERKLPVEAATSPLPKNNLSSPPTPKLDFSSSKPTSPSGGVTNTKKYGPDPILSANLMPSKEESGKIFGIASVSLAQSSGPDNTKCTLGKCGSIHKPVLGPVVPTEAYLGEPLSSKERRKAKVNMTHEQIQKWLIECSSNPDEIQDDLDDDFEEPLKPKTFAPTPPLNRDEKDSGTLSKVNKDVRKESSWTGKGPSLKATAVVMKEDSREKPATLLPTDLGKQNASSESQNSPKPQKAVESITKEKSLLGTTAKKSESFSKLSHDITKSPKPSTSSTTSSPKRLKNTKTVPNTTQKKLPLPKRQPVYSTKPAAEASKKKLANNNFSAFSPENETSVYSFDKEDDVPPPVAKPFRRHSRRESNADENTSSEKPAKAEKVQAKETQQNSISLMLSPEENNKSIKVCIENSEAVAIAKTSKAQADTTSAVPDSDSEGHTFYIPLQGTGATTANLGKADMIQGVAVKLGREGPEGPNQRVIMHATLVTKAQMGSNPTPIPESMNVHEIVKSLLSSNKETPGASKSVPVGTVQPRFKSNTDAQLVSEPALVRVNSNSSLLSGSTKSKSAPVVAPKKAKDATPIKMFNNTAFPRRDDPTQMVEAPIFRPTDKEFQDPMEFIDRITPIAARFGICKIIPPDSFKPECRVSDDMRFTAYNQYVHKMLYRWGPSAKEFSAIKKYLATQSIAMTHPPWIGGMEVDLPRLYHTVQELGGLKEVIEKKKWARVAEEMCIPKLAQDRVTKLDDIYCKYLLPYDTLSPVERQKLFDEVEADWAKREARARRNADRCVNLENISHEDEESSENDDDSDEEVDGVSMECIAKGRSMPLNAFFRIARNTMALWFKNTEPTVADIEAEFWRHVAVRDSHVCVHSGSIDSSGWGYGFPTPGPKAKGSPCAKHPWNLKVLTNNAGSVLRSLGPVMGVTVPTLHVGMLFSACCWYRDPHGLSWIEYLHTGASKIWYGIPDEQSSKFRSALTALIPTHCQNKTIWLPCDTVMVPPHMLTDRGVSLCRVEQKPGEFVVIFPRAYTSSIATGYVVSESVYFATSSWLNSAKDDFRDIHESCEPAMFSLEQLLFAVGNDQRASLNILSQIVPMLNEVYHKEAAARQQLKAAGMTQTEKFQAPATKTKQKQQQLPEEHECDVCRANLYISMVRTTEGNIYCLQHALRNINNGNIQAKQCTLIFTYDMEDIKTLIKKIEDRLGLLQKKMGGSVGSSKKSK